MKIMPFKGILYDTKKVKISDVVTLPYDKISAGQKDIYEKKSPYSMVHLILPKSDEKAGSLLGEWIQSGILKQDEKEAIYVYEQEYKYRGGSKKTRRGFIALLEVKPFGKDTIMPHEKTFSKVVEGRMNLLHACQANIEQIFVLYTGKNINKLLNGKPQINFKDEFGITHRLWPIMDVKNIKNIQNAINKSCLFIADGHHRYTASLQHKEKMHGDNFIMATFVNAKDSGLTILPTHRVLKEVPKLDEKKFIAELEKYFKIKKGFVKNAKGKHVFKIYIGRDKKYTIILKDNVSLGSVLGIKRPHAWLYLDVNILHLLILKHVMGMDTTVMEDEGNIVYVREEEEAIEMVDNKKARIAFILNPTKIEEVKEIVELNDVMPHKSTDFYPKMHSGLVIRKF
jgi:uncharacterized protein (DUF1015 family)